jgi:alpha-amylase
VPAVAFHSYATVEPGQRLYVVGSAPELGAWDPAQGIPLDGSHYPNWTVAVPMAPGTAFEYKYIRRAADGTVVWESRSNRTATVLADGWLSFADGWAAGATVSAAITLRVAADPGQSLFIVGSVAALGSWDPGSAVPLSPVDAATWSATVTLPGSQFIEYKYIRRNPDGAVVWESDPNRSTTTPSGGTATFDDTWR